MGSGAGGLYGTGSVFAHPSKYQKNGAAIERDSVLGIAGEVADRVKSLARDESGYLVLGPGVKMGNAECAMVNHELNGMYHARLEGKDFIMKIPILNHLYVLKARGFDDYEILKREELG